VGGPTVVVVVVFKRPNGCIGYWYDHSWIGEIWYEFIHDPNMNYESNYESSKNYSFDSLRRPSALGNIMMLRRWMLVWRWKSRDMREHNRRCWHSRIHNRMLSRGNRSGCIVKSRGCIGSPLGFLTAAFFWLVSLPIFLALLAPLFGASTSSVHFLSRILRDKLRIVLKVVRG